MSEKSKFSCSDCGVLNCYRQEKEFPKDCPGEGVELERIKDLYRNDPFVSKIAGAAAEIEGLYYCKYTRVEETIAFAKKIGAKKVGIATCIGLINETKTFVKILEAHGVESICTNCKVGSIDKAEAGIPEELKLQKGCFEGMCNPVLQAELLNKEGTDLNIIIGLCVGHDSLFIKYSNAPITTLIIKDRVLGHNPAAALYNANTYYRKLFTP
ncbi:MAG: DUF1847 domain-containing protein [Defluviitaleaceae bacterium]|nr:DUF1847 domain-containing protein [Defluviitaleaceae bacterium]